MGVALPCPQRFATQPVDQPRDDDGRALIHCHHAPQCSPEAIVETLGLSLADLYPSRNGTAQRPRTRGKPTSNRKAKAKPRAYPTPEATIAEVSRKLGSKPSGPWIYPNADGSEEPRGSPRFDFTDPKTGELDKSFRPVHPYSGGWVLGDPPEPLPLYHLPDLKPAPRGSICPRVRSALRPGAMGLGWTPPRPPRGGGSPHRSDWSRLAGKDVVILPDNDPDGERYATAVLGLLGAIGAPLDAPRGPYWPTCGGPMGMADPRGWRYRAMARRWHPGNLESRGLPQLRLESGSRTLPRRRISTRSRSPRHHPTRRNPQDGRRGTKARPLRISPCASDESRR